MFLCLLGCRHLRAGVPRRRPCCTPARRPRGRRASARPGRVRTAAAAADRGPRRPRAAGRGGCCCSPRTYADLPGYATRRSAPRRLRSSRPRPCPCSLTKLLRRNVLPTKQVPDAPNGPGDRRRRIHRQPHLRRAARPRLRGRRRRQPLQQLARRPGPRRARSPATAHRSYEVDCATGGAREVFAATPIDAVDPLRGAQGRRRVGRDAARVLRHQRRRHLRPAARHAANTACTDWSSPRPAPSTATRGRSARPRTSRCRPTNPYARTKLICEQILARRLRPPDPELAVFAAALLQPGRSPPERPARRGPAGRPQQRHAVHRPGRGRPARRAERLRRRLPHPRRHRRARLHPRRGPRRGTPGRPRAPRRPAPGMRVVQPGHRRRDLRARSWSPPSARRAAAPIALPGRRPQTG